MQLRRECENIYFCFLETIYDVSSFTSAVRASVHELVEDEGAFNRLVEGHFVTLATNGDGRLSYARMAKELMNLRALEMAKELMNLRVLETHLAWMR